jgi:hypothetical protein
MKLPFCGTLPYQTRTTVLGSLNKKREEYALKKNGIFYPLFLSNKPITGLAPGCNLLTDKHIFAKHQPFKG